MSCTHNQTYFTCHGPFGKAQAMSCKEILILFIITLTLTILYGRWLLMIVPMRPGWRQQLLLVTVRRRSFTTKHKYATINLKFDITAYSPEIQFILNCLFVINKKYLHVTFKAQLRTHFSLRIPPVKRTQYEISGQLRHGHKRSLGNIVENIYILQCMDIIWVLHERGSSFVEINYWLTEPTGFLVQHIKPMIKPYSMEHS